MKPNAKRIQWLAPLLSLALLLVVCTSGPRAAQPSERQAKAMGMWQERCKTAGEKIYKTVDNVDGIYLLKIRTTTNFNDQFKLDDPYGHDSTGDMYLLNFLRGFYHQRSTTPIPGAPPQVGYIYVEAQDPKDGQRYRYTGQSTQVKNFSHRF
jgi:hypothetical protein